MNHRSSAEPVISANSGADDATNARLPMSSRRGMVEPNWSMEIPRRLWDPSRRLVRSVRDYNRAKEAGGATGYVTSKLAVLRHRIWSIITGAEVPLNVAAIGGGLVLPHPNGVVIHPDCRIGQNCRIFQQVTLGTGPRPGLPELGANVDVGAGAKVLGGVKIGESVVIGANAVVLMDIPAGAIAVGVPAVVKPFARGHWDRESRHERSSQSEKSLSRDPKLGYAVAKR